MKCQSCGRQSESAFCRDCTNETGELKSYGEIVENLTGYYIETQGFDREVAKSVAIGILSHQPAWEAKMERIEKGKDMRMKTFLIVTAVVFTVVGAGIAYWLSTKTKADDTIRFRNFSKLPQAPFENIVKSKVDQFDVFEMMCPADQRLVELDGDYLTMKSLEGSEYSPDYQLYTYNLKSNTGYKFVPESLATRTQLMGKGSGLVFQKANSGELMNWYYSPEKGLLSPLKGQLICQYGRTALVCLNNNLIAYDTLTGTVKKEIKGADGYGASVSDNFVVHFDSNSSNLVIDIFDGASFKYSMQADIENIVANNRYVVVHSVSEAKASTNCIDTTNGSNFWITDNVDNVMISRGDNPYESVICWTEKVKSENKDQNTFLKYLRMTDHGTIYQISKPSSINHVNAYPIAVSSKIIAWDTNNHSDIKSENGLIGSISKNNIWIYNILTDQSRLIDQSMCGHVCVDNWLVAWEKYEGESNDQFFNIKVADIYQADMSKRLEESSTNVFADDGLWMLKKERIMKSDLSTKVTEKNIYNTNIKYREIEIEGDQFTSCNNDYMFGKRVEFPNGFLEFVDNENNQYLYNVNNNRFAKVKKGSQALSNLLGGKSYEWIESQGWETDKDGEEEFVITYSSFDGKSKQFETGVLNSPEFDKDKYHIYAIKQGEKINIFSSKYIISSFDSIHINEKKYLVISIFDLKNKIGELLSLNIETKAVMRIAKNKGGSSYDFETYGHYVYFHDGSAASFLYDIETSKSIQTDKRPFNTSTEMDNDPTVIVNNNNKSMIIKISDYFDNKLDNGLEIPLNSNEKLINYVDNMAIISETLTNREGNSHDKLGKLVFYRIGTGERIVIEQRNYFIDSFIVNKNLYYWTVDRGEKDNQFANVCYAKIK